MLKYEYCPKCLMFEICEDGNDCLIECRPEVVVLMSRAEANKTVIGRKYGTDIWPDNYFSRHNCNTIFQFHQWKQGFKICFRLSKKIVLPNDEIQPGVRVFPKIEVG